MTLKTQGLKLVKMSHKSSLFQWLWNTVFENYKKIFYRSIWWVLMLKNSSKPTFIRENCIAKYIQCIDMEKRRPTIQMLLEIRNRCLIYRAGGWKFSLLRFQPDFYIPNLTLTLYFQSCEKISKSHEFKTFLLKIRQIEGTSTLITN